MCSMPAAGYDFEPPHLHSVVLPDLVSPRCLLLNSIFELRLNSFVPDKHKLYGDGELGGAKEMMCWCRSQAGGTSTR